LVAFFIMDNTNQDSLPDDGLQLGQQPSQPESGNQLQETSGHNEEVIEQDEQPTPPPGVVVASNGAWRDAETGRFVPGGDPINKITEENSAEYHRLQADKKLAGILASNGKLSSLAGSSDEGWANVAGAMYETALDRKSRVAAVQAGRLLGEMTGYLPSGKNGGSDPLPAGGSRITLESRGIASSPRHPGGYQAGSGQRGR
jgi:hypothetical protein